MAMEKCNTKMAVLLKEITKKIRNMEKALLSGAMGKRLKATGSTENKKGRVSSSILMVLSESVFGKMVSVSIGSKIKTV